MSTTGIQLSKAPSLDQWLEYQQQLHPQDIELGLDRVRLLADRLGIGPVDCPRVVVAGTNGKGSSIAMLESIFRTAGYRVGCYTSPHIENYCERLRIDGVVVSSQDFCDAFARIEQVRSGTELTYFEFGTLAALQILDAKQVDVQLLEVGLGGRLDAVNIVDSDIALITQIAIDHVDWLGDTREQIGAEKAAIMRAARPCVCADPDLPQSVTDYADRLGSMLFRSGFEFGYGLPDQGLVWDWRSTDTVLEQLPTPGLIGEFQAQNGAAVLEVVRLLQDRLPVSKQQIVDGLSQVKLAGRFEIVGSHPQWLLDVAHNPQACAALAQNLDDLSVAGRRLGVLGMLEDKNIHASLKPLLEIIDCWYLAAIDHPRGATEAMLQQVLLELGCQAPIRLFSSLADAISTASGDAQQNDQIVVFGSFHTVAAAR
ncbi:MAG: bifunctional tetrahydrofolate synthase/dihydrofolate synthase [Immundisolibacteraceae bacterium]|nr:bifunctional tetrahydrofolate synthase/dihydrofolate synthase [Immundisolibacteraceae bacterium]